MEFRGDGRAQSIQIGAVLLFAVVILLFATYQAYVVPNQNREIEFDHSQRVQQHLQDVRNAVVSMSGASSSRSVTVPLGTRYPSRVLAVNPGPASGSLRTVGTTDTTINATIDNATATGETGDFWNGTAHSYSTGWLTYRADYNEFGGAPTTVYGNTVLYNEFPSANLTVTGQTLVDGRRISLVTLNGTYSANRIGSASLDVRPVSASDTVVSVTNETDETLTITVPTRLSASDWRDLIDATNEYVTQGGHVVSVTDVSSGTGSYQLVQFELEGGVTYDLQLSRVGLGTRVESPDSAYLTDVGGTAASIPEGGTTKVTVEVRDAFDNPLTGEYVIAGTQLSSSSVTPNNVTSDGDGRVTLTYQAPDDVSGTAQKTDTLHVSLDTTLTTAVNGSSFDGSTPINVTIPVSVDNSDGSGLGGASGGGGVYDINWQDPSGVTGVDCPDGPDGTCDVDASQSATVPLQVDTTPTAIGTLVDYSLNNSTVGSLNVSSGETSNDGTDWTEFSVSQNGNVDVYTTSGGSSDVLELSISNAGAACTARLQTDFESGSLSSEPFSYSAGPGSVGDGGVNSMTSNSGIYSAWIAGDAGSLVSEPITTSECSSITVQYWVQRGSPAFSEDPDLGEDLVVEYLRSNGNWKSIETYPGEGPPGETFDESQVINQGNALHDEFRIRFRLADGSGPFGGDYYDYWHVDDVQVDANN